MRGSGSVPRIPLALNKLLKRDIACCNESVIFEEDHINGNIGISAAQDQIDALMIKYSSKFVLAIVQSTSSWALTTHLDAFYQQNSSLDDCALPRNADIDKNAKVTILQKTEGPYNFNELIIQCGPIQLLAVGGYYGKAGSKTKSAFLGSALPKGCQLSIDETYNILIPFFQPE